MRLTKQDTRTAKIPETKTEQAKSRSACQYRQLHRCNAGEESRSQKVEISREDRRNNFFTPKSFFTVTFGNICVTYLKGNSSYYEFEQNLKGHL